MNYMKVSVDKLKHVFKN